MPSDLSQGIRGGMIDLQGLIQTIDFKFIAVGGIILFIFIIGIGYMYSIYKRG